MTAVTVRSVVETMSVWTAALTLKPSCSHSSSVTALRVAVVGVGDRHADGQVRVAERPAHVLVVERAGHEAVDPREPRVGQRELADTVAAGCRDDLLAAAPAFSSAVDADDEPVA